MKLNISNKCLVIFLMIIIPAILLITAMVLNSGVCVFMIILIWIGLIMVVAFIPYYKEDVQR